MTNKSHNKKRNSALVLEFLTRKISQSLVEDDQRASSQALKILRRHFKQGTELYKEFRLINSLVKTTVSSEAVASSIIQEAKAVAKSFDVVELDREKSLLIKNINHGLNDENFYDQQVGEYKMLATVQTLLNDWRTPGADLNRMALYEDQLVKWLTSEKREVADQVLTEDTPGTSRLLMKVMMKKLNDKYSGALTTEQKSLIRSYALSTTHDDSTTIKLKLVEVKTKLLSSIDAFLPSTKDNEHFTKKLVEARTKLLTEELDVIDDETVTRFMLYTKLYSELESGEDKND